MRRSLSLATIAAVFFIAGHGFASEYLPADYSDVVYPDTKKAKIKLSSSDINRVVCQGGVGDVIFSKEKGLSAKVVGSDVYLKYSVVKRGEEKLYARNPTELFIVCGGQTYNMIAEPAGKIPAQIVRLSSGMDKKIAANQSMYSGIPFEKKVLQLIKEVYTDNLPDSYTITSGKVMSPIFRDISLEHKKTVEVDGEGLRAKEYVARLRPGMKTVKLTEKSFLRDSLTENPVAITIETAKLVPGAATRIIIVEQKPSQQAVIPNFGVPKTAKSFSGVSEPDVTPALQTNEENETPATVAAAEIPTGPAPGNFQQKFQKKKD